MPIHVIKNSFIKNIISFIKLSGFLISLILYFVKLSVVFLLLIAVSYSIGIKHKKIKHQLAVFLTQIIILFKVSITKNIYNFHNTYGTCAYSILFITIYVLKIHEKLSYRTPLNMCT